MVNTQTLLASTKPGSVSVSCGSLRGRQRQMIEIGQVVLKGPKFFVKQ